MKSKNSDLVELLSEDLTRIPVYYPFAVEGEKAIVSFVQSEHYKSTAYECRHFYKPISKLFLKIGNDEK